MLKLKIRVCYELNDAAEQHDDSRLFRELNNVSRLQIYAAYKNRSVRRFPRLNFNDEIELHQLFLDLQLSNLIAEENQEIHKPTTRQSA